MNTQNVEKKAVIKRETKNRIRADFDRSPLWERIKAKFFSLYFLTNIIWWIFRLVLLIGITYVVLYPHLTKLTQSVMAPEDFVDVTVRLIPKNFTLDTYSDIINELGYWKAFGSTFTLSLCTALIQTFICCLIGYGFAKFKFKGRNAIFLLVMLTMIIPHQTMQYAMFMEFRYFDILGIVRLLKGGGIEFLGWNIKDLGAVAEVLDEAGNVVVEAKEGFLAGFFEKLNILPDAIKLGHYKNNGMDAYRINMEVSQAGINLMNTYLPLVLLSLGGLAFKNGLYIFLLRQFFRGLPDELEESAYMDGCGSFRTFVQIILPLSIPMMITVFLFAFCWQWTDDFYTTLFFPSSKVNLLAKGFKDGAKIKGVFSGGHALYLTAAENTCGLLIIFPLVFLYSFCQKYLVQGIEHSGIAN